MRYTVTELRDHLGYPGKTVYARIDAVSSWFPGEVETGKKNKKFVSDKGFVILRRLKELEDMGHSMERALNRISEELETQEPEREHLSLIQAETTVKQAEHLDLTHELINILKSQLKSKDEEIEFLRDQLRTSQAMLPAKNHTSQLTRIDALKMLFIGRS